MENKKKHWLVLLSYVLITIAVTFVFLRLGWKATIFDMKNVLYSGIVVLSAVLFLFAQRKKNALALNSELYIGAGGVSLALGLLAAGLVYWVDEIISYYAAMVIVTASCTIGGVGAILVTNSRSLAGAQNAIVASILLLDLVVVSGIVFLL